jgi:transcriptional regulator with GAF, ATPase, and Fis domain
MNHDPQVDDAPRTGTSEAGASLSSEAASTADSEPAASRDNGLAPTSPIHLLESTGTFSCPHCQETIRLEGVGLKFEGAETSETVQLDLRHPEESLDVVVDDVRRLLAIRALREANGVKVKAAEIAGMKYTTFYELVRRLGITDEDIYAADT